MLANQLCPFFTSIQLPSPTTAAVSPSPCLYRDYVQCDAGTPGVCVVPFMQITHTLCVLCARLNELFNNAANRVVSSVGSAAEECENNSRKDVQEKQREIRNRK